jgi:hypothetical protein
VSVRATRWAWFLGLWLMLPWPMALLAHASVPAARYALLTLVCLAMAALEGAGGPVPWIVALFAAHALVYTGLAWAIAWAAGRALSPLGPARRRLVTLGALALAFALTLGFDVYRTPFGSAPFSNLLGVLS